MNKAYVPLLHISSQDYVNKHYSYPCLYCNRRITCEHSRFLEGVYDNYEDSIFLPDTLHPMEDTITKESMTYYETEVRLYCVDYSGILCKHDSFLTALYSKDIKGYIPTAIRDIILNEYIHCSYDTHMNRWVCTPSKRASLKLWMRDKKESFDELKEKIASRRSQKRRKRKG